jgi:dTDP-4-dehydrorhamnose reductase
MKVLLTGSAGQLGQALVDSKPDAIELISTTRQELDLSDTAACRLAVQKFRPDWVLNAGAYTAVDQAESEPELVHAINAEAPEAFAQELDHQGGRLLQVSTDFVFNGQQGSPYKVDQPPTPLGVYGGSKAAGEQAIQRVFGHDNPQGIILRTSWVMGPVGQNFALTMLRLHREREQLGVVADQVGCPSSTLNLAAACWRTITLESHTSLPPILHWSDAGAASWYDVAVAIGELGHSLGLVDAPAQVNPISTADYPTPASRPNYSLLDCTTTRSALQLDAQHWQEALKQLLLRVQAD